MITPARQLDTIRPPSVRENKRGSFAEAKLEAAVNLQPFKPHSLAHCSADCSVTIEKAAGKSLLIFFSAVPVIFSIIILEVPEEYGFIFVLSAFV